MSNFSKFKRNDRVKNSNGRKGKVLDTYRQDGEFMIHVEMDSGFRQDYKESDIQFYHKDIENKKRVADDYIGDKCPKCSTPWTLTRFGAKQWKDCLPCGKTAEDLLDKNTQVDTDKEMQDLLDEWNGMIF